MRIDEDRRRDSPCYCYMLGRPARPGPLGRPSLPSLGISKMNHGLVARFQGLSTRTDLEPYVLIRQASSFSFKLQVSDYTEIHGSMLSEFFQVALRLRVNVA